MCSRCHRAFLWGLVCLLAVSVLPVSAQEGGGILRGSVREKGSGAVIPGAVLLIDEGDIWAYSNLDGLYEFTSLSEGHYILKAECLGYVSQSVEISISKEKATEMNFELSVNSLALEEVVVTSERAKSGLNTTTNLGRDALNHLQMSSLTDISALLPGGKTINPDLTVASTFSLRQGSSSAGNAAFATAVELDGVRIGNNAGFSELAGVDTRSISVDNVESVEVITGVPSVEYGDLGSGMVRIHTKHGKTPTNLSFSVNPRTYQASVSKGIGLKDGGVLNLSGEWARATKKLSSPYESYTRRGFSLSYSNNFKNLRLESGLSGNIGGMNSEDDPDAFSGEYSKVRANSLRANTSLAWMLNRPLITSLKAEASISYEDDLSRVHKYNSYASSQPAVHSEKEGYYLAESLPLTYYSDQITDSKELDFAASVKYSLNRNFASVKSKFKAGVQWKANGNVGQGEYYLDPTLAASGYRPRPYTDYPFMHNLSLYAEEELSLPIAETRLSLSAGIRQENVFVKGIEYQNVSSLSPRFNAKWDISKRISIRGGWGIAEKLPSFYILFPRQEYRDIQCFAYSYGDQASYVYYTIPYTLEYNPELIWQRSSNSELGLDLNLGSWSLSLVGYANIIQNPYSLENQYTPFSYRISSRPSGFTTGEATEIRVDNQSGEVYVRGSADEGWTLMDTKVVDRTFVKTSRQVNAAPVRRYGAELTVDFPEIRPIRTKFRLDAAWTSVSEHDERLSYYYQSGWSHSSEANRSYQYVGIYVNSGSSTSVSNGRLSHSLDANLTAITHIPEARLVITLRLEASLLRRSRNISVYEGQPYAQRNEDGYWYIEPVAYMDLDGEIHPFTEAEAANPAFSNLILKSGNIYTLDQDGYGPYASANLSITKEVGDKVSISFFANNFTNSRPYVVSIATGVGSIFTPAFYYGLSCRLKF
ncbi:MAG: TonB-dependent receptor domain-containing protein [Candidatus Cryptobacteroides sp.]